MACGSLTFPSFVFLPVRIWQLKLTQAFANLKVLDADPHLNLFLKSFAKTTFKDKK